MIKLTRHLKKNKKNKTYKTYKKGGAVSNPLKSSENTTSEIKTSENTTSETKTPETERIGIFDYIGEKVEDEAKDVVTSVGDIGLRAFGLERLGKADEKPQNSQASEFISNIKNTVDKTGATIITNVNKVLGSDTVKENLQQAAQDTAQIVKQGAEIFNKAMNSPEVKEELKEAIDNAADIGSVAIEASKKPFEKAADVLAQSVPKAAASTISGLIKVGTDAMAAVPYVGSAIEFGKIINDSSKAVSGVVTSTTDAIEAASDLIIETKKNFTEAMKKLEKLKEEGVQTYNRTNKSINEFENPLDKIKNSVKIDNPLDKMKNSVKIENPLDNQFDKIKKSTSQNAGGKSRKRLFKKNMKTKKVRFLLDFT